MRSGADALVIEGMEAGGHIGPVSTSVLAQEILPHVAAEIPVFVAGGIGRGEAIAAYLEMGAVGVQLGTRFVCAHECIAHPNFKKAFLRASARDAIPSVQIDPRLPVIPVRALKNREMENFAAKQREVAQKLDEGAIEMAEAQLQIEHYWAGALRRAVIDGDVESGIGDGRPVGRHGQARRTGRRHHPGTGRGSRGGPGIALAGGLRKSGTIAGGTHPNPVAEMMTERCNAAEPGEFGNLLHIRRPHLKQLPRRIDACVGQPLART